MPTYIPTLVMNSMMSYVTLEIPKSVQYTLSIVNNKHNNQDIGIHDCLETEINPSDSNLVFAI